MRRASSSCRDWLTCIAISHCTRVHCRASNTPRAPSSALCGRRMRSAACCAPGLPASPFPAANGSPMRPCAKQSRVGFWRAREWSSRVARSAITVVFSIPTPTLPPKEPRPIRRAFCAIRVMSLSARPRKQCKRGVDMIKIADSSWGDVQTVADDEISAVVDEAHRHNVKVTIHSRGSTSTRAAAKAGVDLIYHGDWANESDLDVVAEAGMPIAPVLTSPWIGVEHGAAARGFGDRVRHRLRMQLDTSFQMIRNARARGIPILSGSDTGNASAFTHGRWHGKEAELFVKEVGMSPMEAILANTSGNAAMVNLAGEVGVIAPGKLADIVIWDSDPIADITVLQHPEEISAIIKDGRVIDRETVGGFSKLREELGRSGTPS